MIGINYSTIYKENFNHLISVCRNCHEKIHANGKVFFGNLKANFEVLKYCQNCKKYHNDINSGVICNECNNSNKNPTLQILRNNFKIDL